MNDISILEIIRKENRSSEELKYVFNVLFKSDNTVTKTFKYSDIVNWNNILNELRLLSKSRLHLYNWCPFRFKLQYILRQNRFIELQITIDGKNLHWANETLWKLLKVDDFIKTNDYRHLLLQKYTKLIPSDELKREFIQKMIEYFIKFESDRIQAIYNDLGKSREVIERYVFPVALELMIENYDLWLMGIIDRIDRATNDKLIFIDYKYGKPKDYELKYNKTYRNRELGFYAILPQGKEVYGIKNDKDKGDYLVPIKDILGDNVIPYYGAMPYMQSLESIKLYSIKKITITNTWKNIMKFWNALETGIFKCKPNNSCYEWCPFYWDICRYNSEWIEIEKSIGEF